MVFDILARDNFREGDFEYCSEFRKITDQPVANK